jgi:GDP-mannose transporter
MHALKWVNVETFIVCRASCPLLISIGDYLFLGRELPSAQSWLALVGIALGAVGYVVTDQVRWGP